MAASRSHLAGLATVVLVAAAAGGPTPGRAAGAPPAGPTWTAAVCGALVAWQHRAERDARSIAAAGRTPATARAQAVAAVTDLGAAGAALRAAIRRAGVPPLPHGTSLASALGGATTDAAGVATLDRSASRLDASSAASATRSTAVLAAAVAARSQAVGRVFLGLGASYGSPELRAALDQTPACELVHA